MKKKLLIIANRLPVRFENTEVGMKIHDSEGGLATGLASLNSVFTKEWVGWPGVYASGEEEEKEIIDRIDKKYHPVFLTEKEIEHYYEGFSNETLWPLSHYFMKYTQFRAEDWEYYYEVNKKFCKKILEVVNDGDIIWVQDYHLMLLPGLLREQLENTNPIGFFLHIPFPSFELFRTLPWRKELLEGILGADLVGMHTFEYVKNFTNSVYRILGYETRMNSVNIEGRMSYLNSFPMSIDFEKFDMASESKEVIELVSKFRKSFGEVKLLLSVDRLDYTKGITNRLRAFDGLLKDFPDLKSKVSLIMLAVPSRDNVHEYKHLKEEVDEMVGNINGRHSTLTWTPIHYFYRSVPFEQLVALYNLADIGLVTPLRDGMNLVAKEYVASRNKGTGVLVLSEMAGAAIELDAALLVNPNDIRDISRAMYTALHMSEDEQSSRLKKMRAHVKEHSVQRWGAEFTSQLESIYEQAKLIQNKNVGEKETAEICANFNYASERIIFLDYDGTLMPFYDNPYDAKPDEELIQILNDLSAIATVVLVSGRDHQTMDEWFGNLPVELVAEHGVWKKVNNKWKQESGISGNWKSDIYPVLHEFVEKTPGAFIEEKPYSLAFHYRKTDSWLSEMRAPQLIGNLIPFCEPNRLNILDGNKVVEIRVAGIDKGGAARKWLNSIDWDFVLALGDDKTDEDMFAVMPDSAYTINVGARHSNAKWRIRNCNKVRELLKNIIALNEISEKEKKVLKKAV